MKQRRFGGHSLTSFTFRFGHAQLSRTRKDGSVETVQRHLSDTCSNAEADPVQALRGDVPKRARVLGAPENATPASKRARRDEALEEHEKR